jgi:hypothetical protein
MPLIIYILHNNICLMCLVFLCLLCLLCLFILLNVNDLYYENYI